MEEELLDVTKKSGVVFIGRIIGVLFGLVFNFIVARYMGAEAYGRFMYVYTFISFFPIITRFGLDQGLVSFLPPLVDDNKVEERNGLITSSILFTLITGFVLSTIIITNSKFIATNILNSPELVDLIRYSTPLLILLAFTQLSRGIFRGIGIIKYFVQGQNILTPIVKIACIITFSFLGFKIYGILISFYISLGLTSLYLFYKILKMGFLSSIKSINHGLLKDVFRFSFPLLLTGLLGFLINRIDTFMIGYFLSDDKVGIYNIALRIGTMSSFILIAFNTMFAPMISSLHHKGEMDKLAAMYKIITKWILAINLVAFSIILLFNRDIMHLFGKEFIAGSTALVLISIGQVVNAGVGSAGYINVMTGHPHYELYTNILVVGMNVTLNYALIPNYGINGAAVASLISVSLTNIIKLLLVYKDHKIHPYNFDYFKVVGSVTISFMLVYYLNNIIQIFWLIKLLLLTFLFFVMTAIIYYFIGGLSTEDLLVLKKLVGKLYYRKK
ncbi:flippase [Halothermothrix orenii]|uniref:Polysaccharide biosynthesis protein n=1 Tax=Halothermothrix orenii (strain H 168 / OCM 544 / DSM 9562) TaxID=373903 RepID=B8D178_HALOH|nr:flippase [Halothermothrix orenii]ACL71030.1 polysaccharide biosynthesis protein [Halothermothrix orenii H 168]